MQIKTYRSKNIAEGLKKVKEELGSDAVILTTRKVSEESKDPRVEIVAAIDHQDSQPRDTTLNKSLHGDDIKTQLKEIKDTLSLFFSSRRFFYELKPDRDLANIYNSFVVQGLNEVYALEIIQNLAFAIENEKFRCSQITINEILKDIFKKRMEISDPFHKNGNSGPLFYSFVGPTGAGKTTTLAKIAAHLKLNCHYNIGFISLDTFRIGAVEQLRIYAQILGIPMEVVSKVDDISQILGNYSKLDFVLVDTIGKNFLNQKHVIDMQRHFERFPKTNHLLVLSANSKNSDLTRTIQMFEDYPFHSFIFTKIDETTTFGNIINQLFRFQKPICYFGTGQRVPEDIEHATKEKVFNLLMKRSVSNEE